MKSSLESRVVRITRMRNFLSSLIVLSLMVAVMAVPALASSGDNVSDISSAVSTGLKSAYDLITSIIMPIGALAFAFAAAKLMVGGRRAMEEGQSKLLVILLVLAGVYLAPVIIQEVGGWFSNVSSGSSIWG